MVIAPVGACIMPAGGGGTGTGGGGGENVLRIGAGGHGGGGGGAGAAGGGTGGGIEMISWTGLLGIDVEDFSSSSARPATKINDRFS